MKDLSKTELTDRTHQEILAEGAKRFPLESYQQLLASGVSQEQALEMLGFSADDVPKA